MFKNACDAKCRLELLKREKQSLAREVEAEEEYLTGTLQKRMMKLGCEKADLENRLEAEQARRALHTLNKSQRAAHVNTYSVFVPGLHLMTSSEDRVNAEMASHGFL